MSSPAANSDQQEVRNQSGFHIVWETVVSLPSNGLKPLTMSLADMWLRMHQLASTQIVPAPQKSMRWGCMFPCPKSVCVYHGSSEAQQFNVKTEGVVVLVQGGRKQKRPSLSQQDSGNMLLLLNAVEDVKSMDRPDASKRVGEHIFSVL